MSRGTSSKAKYFGAVDNDGVYQLKTWKEWSLISGDLPSTMKGRETRNRGGHTNYTPRQVVGLDDTPKRRAKHKEVMLRDKKRAPLGSQYFIHASFYKICRKNMTWIFINDEWRRSGKEVHEVKAGCRV